MTSEAPVELISGIAELDGVERPDEQLGGHAAVTSSPGRSVIRNASPSASGSASDERSSAPRATKTCCSGSSGSTTVSPPREPGHRERRARGASRTAAAGSSADATGTSSPRAGRPRATSYDGAPAGLVAGVSQACTNRVGPARSRRSRCARRRSRPTAPGPRRAATAPAWRRSESVCTQRAGEHPRDDLDVAVRVVVEARCPARAGGRRGRPAARSATFSGS